MAPTISLQFSRVQALNEAMLLNYLKKNCVCFFELKHRIGIQIMIARRLMYVSTDTSLRDNLILNTKTVY